MALQFIVDSLDSVDESARSLYVQDGEKFRLDLDGYEDPTGLKSALQRERDANKDATKKLNEAKQFAKQFDGLDVESIKALLAKTSQDEETRLIAEGKLDEVVNRRTERLRSDLEKQRDAAIEQAKQAEARANKFDQRVLSDAIREAAAKAGVSAHAVEDVILRARDVFRLDADGNAVAYNGSEVIYGKDGATPLKPSEWVDSLREDKPHYWPSASGAGQVGDRGRGALPKGDFGGNPNDRVAAIANKFPELGKQ